jgi:hypothetical protein
MQGMTSKSAITTHGNAWRICFVAILLVFAGLGAGAPGVAPLSSPGSDPESNLQYLQDLHRRDPQQYERLVRNFNRFRALSSQQQEKLRRFDRQLHDEDSATQSRLLHVLGEYASWLTRLPSESQQRVAAATTADERLQIVRELKEQEWLAHLPLPYRMQLKAASDAERKSLLDRWHREEREQRDEWAEMARWETLTRERPVMAILGQESFKRELQTYVEKRLMPMLSPQEKAQLRTPDGEVRRPMLWLRSVAEISERHPVLALEPKYTRRSELPAEYKKALDELSRGPARERINKLPEGKWPDYPIEVTELLRARKVSLKSQLGPATAKEISPDVERFVQSLQSLEKEKLKAVEGKWPEYPQMLHELAHKKKIVLPDLGLPGDPRIWDALRRRAPNPLPVPPEHLLRQFALELNQSEPDSPHLSLQDPHDREIIIRRFLEQNPDWRKRLESQDRTKNEAKAKNS